MEFPSRLRSLLFVPADNAAKLERARSTAADALILDLEDAVAPPDKQQARSMAIEFLRDRGAFAGPVLVRCHGCTSPEFEKDRRVLEASSPDGIVLSKCRSAADVLPIANTSVVPIIESAEGLLNAYAIAAATPRVIALAFGAEDFCSDIGITRTPGEPELLYARSALVAASRAAGKYAIDTPLLAYRDETALREAAQRARNLGFSGKLAIHPAQVATIHEIFRPSEREIVEAKRILEWAADKGPGATALDGRMIDEAVLRKAREILRLQR